MIKYQKTEGLTEVQTHYCPGCTHGILHKLVAEVLEELLDTKNIDVTNEELASIVLKKVA